MSKTNSFYETVDQIVTYGIEKRILHLYTSDVPFEGTKIMINGRQVLNFGSCSYLGLEFDRRVKEGAIKAIEKYGTQFSESRAYVSLGSYKELETLLERIFEAPCVITPTTTLGHIANIPVLVEDEDAVILDQQVHNSVQTAVQIVKGRGVHIELLRHNRMDLLEERIKELRGKFKRIWYMADGIYSMFGDCTPIDKVYEFLDRYPEFYYYVDDAHGMSIHGKNGRGFVLSKHKIHKKMMLVTSLNKAFASGGGLLVYGDKEIARKVGTVGGPLLSSGPMQPSAIGAAIEVAKIHLSDEIIEMQERLRDNIEFTLLMLKKYKLPVISKAGAAIFFVGVSLPKLGHNIVRRMFDAGYYVNLGVFPTVPMKQTGVRFTVTRLHTFKEIESMVSNLAEIFPMAMSEENITLPQIYKAFRIKMPEEQERSPAGFTKQSGPLKLEHLHSIQEVDKEQWDKLFTGKGTFDWNGLKVLEESFSENDKPEDNWLFDYLLVRGLDDQIVAASFFTTSLWKDDMLSPAVVSEQVEAKRKTDFYYLTGKVICSGSLITEGEHLYLNVESSSWKEAMILIFEKVYSLQDEYGANHIVFRDFHSIKEELDHLMADNGFFRLTMPDSHVIDDLSWKDKDEFYHSLSLNSRNHLRKKVLRHRDKFDVSVIEGNVSQKVSDYWYRLYLNVKEKSLELNTFALPKKMFKAISADNTWEVIQLHLKDTYVDEMPCCVVFCYKSGSAYIPMIIGMDYTFNSLFGIYRQALYQVVLRAKKLGKEKIMFGFSATVEKKKVGAKVVPTFAYMHARDTFQLEVLSSFSKLHAASN
jgi:7-keto-8-aminopelargonate synthetase-like enzyme/predicted N-acyltransferase